MSQQSKNQNIESAQNVGDAVSKTEKFFKENGKKISIIAIAAAAVALIIVAFSQFYVKPLKAEAANQSFVAEQYFRSGVFDLALNGDGNAYGFAQIIDEYGKKGGAAVYLYAGICELQLGNADNAVDYLKKYSTKDEIMQARAYCLIGDAYAMKEDLKSALSQYEKAANHADNAYAAGYLLKAGLIAEELGDNAKALSLYERVKKDYPQTLEGYEIEKYINRIQVK
jgi:tetratricopeptide (TPR) repeat protein